MTDELRSMLAENDILFLFEGGFPDASLIWLLPCHDVPGGIGNIPGTLSTDSIRTPNVVGAGAATNSFGCGSTTATIFNWVLP